MKTRNNDSTPRGLVGVVPKDPVGVVVTVGVKGANGAPAAKNRFFMMRPEAASHKFTSGQTSLKREPHPAFTTWNELAKIGPGPHCIRNGILVPPEEATGGEEWVTVASLKGNLVHADLGSATFWNRSAHKLPAPHPAPPSQRPACEGDGVRAVRFMGMKDEAEDFQQIPCPNAVCPFAMSGLCKPYGSLLFRLRWNSESPFERAFPSTLAMWTTRGWNSLRALLGMFEYILGTERVAPWEPREEWRPGVAESLGIKNPSLFGLPFTITIGEKTNPARGTRFPVVSFSIDGDPVAFFAYQRQQRALAGGIAGLLPATVEDPEVMHDLRHTARREFDPADIEVE